jgi:hypothetical protein
MDILRAVSYKGWELSVHTLKYREPFPLVLRPRTIVVDVNKPDGGPTLLYGQATFLEDWMGEKVIVQRIFDVIRTTEIHEAAEQFNYKGIRVFNPHIKPEDQDKLLGLAVGDDLIAPAVAEERDRMSLKELYPADFFRNDYPEDE